MNDLQFYQRNGQPYPICDKDNLIVEVTEGTRRVATLIELGGTDPLAANTAVVKFTVRHAGQYRIAVLIGSCHVHGSPFLKNFLPGTIRHYPKDIFMIELYPIVKSRLFIFYII